MCGSRGRGRRWRRESRCGVFEAMVGRVNAEAGKVVLRECAGGNMSDDEANCGNIVGKIGGRQDHCGRKITQKAATKRRWRRTKS